MPINNPPRILVAEDVGSSRLLLVSLLQQLTCAEVHEARDGASALDMFRSLSPELTFLDIQMPGLDGLDVLTRIRSEKGNAPFVAIVSGHSESGMVLRASQLHVSGFVVKPFSGARLREVLLRYVEKSGDHGLLKAAPGGPIRI